MAIFLHLIAWLLISTSVFGANLTISPAIVLKGEEAEIACAADSGSEVQVELWRKFEDENQKLATRDDAKKKPAAFDVAVSKGDKTGLKDRSEIESINNGLKLKIKQVSCYDRTQYECNVFPKSPGTGTMKNNLKVIEINDPVDIETEQPACPTNDCKQCDSGYIAHGRTGEKVTLKCNTKVSFPDSESTPNVFSWEIGDQSIPEITNRNPTMKFPEKIEKDGIGNCAYREKQTSKVTYTFKKTDSRNLNFKCKITFKSGNQEYTREEVAKVCHLDAFAGSLHPTPLKACFSMFLASTLVKFLGSIAL